MSAIDLIKSGVWDYSGAVLTGTIAVPIAVELISTAIDVVKNPGLIQKKWKEAQEFIVDSFSQRPDELSKDFRKRVFKNVVVTIGILSLFAAALCLPFIVLPSAFAIPAAIAAIALLGRTLSHAGEIKQKIASLFTQQVGELDEAYKKRFRTNVIIVVCFAAALCAVGVAAAFIIPFVLKVLATTPIWSIPDKLFNFQNKTTVVIAYLCLGFLHLCKAAYHFKKGERALALFHLSNAALSVFFPLMYLKDPVTRLHHSFTGLLLQLLPFRSMRIIGGAITLDSFANVTFSGRGYWSSVGFHQYDYMNLIVENFSSILLTYSATCSYQLLKDRFFATKTVPVDIAQMKAAQEKLDEEMAEFLANVWMEDLLLSEQSDELYNKLRKNIEHFEGHITETLPLCLDKLCEELGSYSRSEIPAKKLAKLEKLMDLADSLAVKIKQETQDLADDYLHKYKQIV